MEKILEDREKRYNRIMFLLEKWKLPVLCGKINYPGCEKNTEEAGKAFLILKRVLVESFKENTEYLEVIKGYDGESLVMVLKKESAAAKTAAVAIEERHELGRIFDIDVYTENGAPISRGDIGRDTRKCIVCGEDARICVRSRRHSLDEVVGEINKLIKSYGEKNED